MPVMLLEADEAEETRVEDPEAAVVVEEDVVVVAEARVIISRGRLVHPFQRQLILGPWAAKTQLLLLNTRT